MYMIKSMIINYSVEIAIDIDLTQFRYTLSKLYVNGHMRGPPPPEKSHKYRVSQQYWSGSLKITKLRSQPSMLGHHRCFAGGLVMARLIVVSKKKKKKKKKKSLQTWTPSDKTFRIRAYWHRADRKEYDLFVKAA